MALFSFRHSVKTFSPKRESGAREAVLGQTQAHLRYITRETAARVVLRERVEGTNTAVADDAEASAAKRGGRVAERFIIALPCEASADQRVALVRAYAEALTNSEAGFIAAIHDQAGNDIANPHFHLVAFDKHIKGGGRGRPRSVLGFARKNAVEGAAALWADTHNTLMASWGYGPQAGVSPLSFEAQGIQRLATIHEGATARRMAADGKVPASKLEWHHIDAGQSRSAANDLIREINALAQGDSNETADGLGASLHRNPAMGQEGGRPDRTTPWGGGGTNTTRAPSFLFGGGDGPRVEAPPFLAAPHNGDTTIADKPERPTSPKPTARPLPWVRFRRVRRVFADLMFFRDSLIAAIRATNAIAEAATDQTDTAAQSIPPKPRVKFHQMTR
jgi:hypothetical protein